MEVPQYTLRPNTSRMVMPWIFKLLGLAVLFYGGIYFNVKYALKMSIPPLINVVIMVFIIILVVTQLILYKVKYGHYKYEFYTNRVDFEGKDHKTFLYGNFEQATLKQNIFDKVFNTGLIKLDKKFVIGPISNVTQIKNYLEQLVRYYQYTQQRSRMLQQQAATGTMQRPAQTYQTTQAAAQQTATQRTAQQTAQRTAQMTNKQVQQ
jgi:hypothetical protein